jgi:hypothetical protein
MATFHVAREIIHRRSCEIGNALVFVILGDVFIVLMRPLAQIEQCFPFSEVYGYPHTSRIFKAAALRRE